MTKLYQLFKEALSNEEQDYTSGSINRAILLLAIPMILEVLMEGLFALVDAYFVGKISEEAVTAVGLTETFTTIVYSIAIGISIAATAMVSRRIGEKNKDGAAKAAFQAIVLGVIASFMIGIFGYHFAPDILAFMGANEAVVEIGVNYTRIILSTNIVIALLFILNGIFRGIGDAVIAMYALWIANILNMILDPLFIFGIGFFPEMGVTGAAIATSIGRGIGVCFQLYILFRGTKMLRLQIQYLKIIPSILRRLVRVASTGAAQFFVGSASWIFLARLVADFGTNTFAGYTFAVRIVIFCILPAWGMANAAATLVGQNLGANKPDRAEQSVWRAGFYNMLFMVALGVIFMIGAPFFIGIFSDNPDVIAAGSLSLRIFCIGYVFFAYGMVFGQAFGGAGDTTTPTLINLFCFWAVEIPLAYVLANLIFESALGVFIAIAIAESLLALVSYYFFRKGKWKLVKI